ncbi:MAG: NUDIX domain-containing protein [Candidatus Acinetobacter avistercoris]|uniref:NUDIX hydrolase n=1 Tax=Acinetobacter sp. KS-LM10 TaxID=3120518 RepID=UPI001F9D6226|nr:NUDIX domain-containing protein [Candidatus Acinetobacter avistercoris]
MKTITVAAAIIVNDQNQLLLVRKQNTQYFMQVGGKLEENEAPDEAMLREIKEEIGVDASIDQFIGRFETPAANEPNHLLVSYLYQVSFDGEPKVDGEIAEMKWINLSNQDAFLAPLTTEIVIPWCQKYLNMVLA